MSRFILSAAIIAMTLTCVGCATSPPAKQRLALSPYLLFDRHPGPTSASDIAYRSHWPNAASGVVIRERIQFQDRVYDSQGRNLGRHQDYRRNFRSRRIGVIER